MNAQFSMSFSGEAPNTPGAQEAFKKLFEEICRQTATWGHSDNHLNDNGQWYSYDESGNATATNYHERDIETKPTVMVAKK